MCDVLILRVLIHYVIRTMNTRSNHNSQNINYKAQIQTQTENRFLIFEDSNSLY
jgi:hypothetical protein